MKSWCLTARQQRIKELVANPYGDLVHEGQLLDPVCRDIEALLLNSQERVSGDVHVLMRPGNLFVEGVDSPYSLLAASRGVYGEAAGEWTRHRCPRVFKNRVVDRCVPSARRPGLLALSSSKESAPVRSVVVDKIASITQACGLAREVRIAADIPAEEGVWSWWLKC